MFGQNAINWAVNNQFTTNDCVIFDCRPNTQRGKRTKTKIIFNGHFVFWSFTAEREWHTTAFARFLRHTILPNLHLNFCSAHFGRSITLNWLSLYAHDVAHFSSFPSNNQIIKSKDKKKAEERICRNHFIVFYFFDVAFSLLFVLHLSTMISASHEI